ncbi:hypothetical protein [Hoeflea sp.]|uniref:hypothetical protein n=1 Tax=Hoeflea sp. TaxID=1940281 RepID=UPI003B5236B0
MKDARDGRLSRLQFISGSLDGLIGLASKERFEMLIYLLEMARLEAAALERAEQAGSDIGG